MASTSDFKRGLRIELDGDPFVIVEYSSQTASGRGSGGMIRAKLRNLRSGQLVDRQFKPGDRVKLPDFEIRPCQYLYGESDDFTFMDLETFEQFSLGRGDIEYELGFIRPNDHVRSMMFEGHCIGLELPQTVILEVKDCEPSVQGNTVSAVTKAATLETGLEIQVPMFVSRGEKLVIDTRDSRYVRRA